MLRVALSFVMVCSVTAMAQTQSATEKPEDVSGAWILIVQYPDGETIAGRMSLQVSGDKITGQLVQSRIEGTIANAVITLRSLRPDGQVIATYNGKAQDGTLKGEGDRNGIKLQWSARRPASRLGGPRTHTFLPTEFHRYFSNAIPPALRIFPGDTVQTKSVDAGGSDENSVRRSRPGNPLTGPFYIEGALPGDTLVIKLNRVRTNRDWAQSGQQVMFNALNLPYLMNNRNKPAENFSSRWKLDAAKGIAYLDKPTEALTNLTVPLQPMLGCVAVAPPDRNVIATTDSGPFGGNMDYNQIREGTTIYLPVFHEGALLFMGDGHAAQGDGELTGDALETSMDLEFTVDVIQKSIFVPRAENAEYVMTIGIDATLDLAMRRATTAMANWLQNDYKLNSTEAAMILGFAMKYDVADLVGTQVSIVAKIPKTALAQLKRQ